MPLRELKLGLGKWFLLFSDASQEQGFLRSRRAAQVFGLRVTALVNFLVLVSNIAIFVSPASTIVSSTAFWMRLCFNGVSFTVLGAATLEAVFRRVGYQTTELITVLVCVVFMAQVMVTEDVNLESLESGPCELRAATRISGEVFVVLSIVGTASFSNVVLIIRWCGTLCIMSSAIIVLFARQARWGLFGDPSMWRTVWLVILILAVLSLGKRREEERERAAFIQIVEERSARCRAEFALETFNERSPRQAAREARHGTGHSEESAPRTTATGSMFEALRRIDAPNRGEVAVFQRLIDLGRLEHWLLSEENLSLRSTTVLGQGGFGVVVAGTLCGAEVAVKFPRQRHARCRELSSLGHELRVLRQLRHPNIVLIIGAVLDAQRQSLGIVLERLAGKTLAAFVDESSDPHLNLLTVWHILRGLGTALYYMHTRAPSIVHGDLKDQNVFVEKCHAGVRPKLLDFGLARLLGHPRQPRGTTVIWAAPEMFSRNYQTAASADVYAMGLLLFFMATRTRPFRQYQQAALIRHLRRQGPLTLEWPSTCPYKELYQPLVDMCVSADASRRPTAQGLLDQLDNWQAVQLSRSRRATSDGMESNAEDDVASTPVLIYPDRDPTERQSVLTTLVATMSGWNFYVSEPACCQFHASLAFTRNFISQSMALPCFSIEQRSVPQCRGCGLLLLIDQTCRVCKKTDDEMDGGRPSLWSDHDRFKLGL